MAVTGWRSADSCIQAFLSAGVTMSAADEKVMAHVADVSVTNGKVHERL